MSGETLETAIETLARIDRENAINCAAFGAVGCNGRNEWHSWGDHRLHVASSQVAALADLGLFTTSPAQDTP